MLENKNFKNLLSLLNDEIELQGSTHISITYKKFHQILDDDGIEDFLKYLEYFQRENYLKVTGIEQFNSKILSLSDYDTLCHFNDPKRFNAGPTTATRYVPIFPLEKDIFYLECNEKEIKQTINRNEEATIRDKADKKEVKAEYENSKTIKKYKNKMNIFVSDENGIFTNEKTKKPNYPVKIRSKRFKIIKNLKDGKKDGNILSELFYEKNLSTLSKEIKEVNKIFTEKLNLRDNLIISIDTGGYKLNNDKYNVKFIA